MKTLRDIREELVDVSSHSNRKLKTIIADPKHPHHAAAKAELDRRSMQEKTLTPAEKRKREEIAKAMERENPGMPMAKKMAIATATAKKVAEEAEQIDEAAKTNLDDYYMDVVKAFKKENPKLKLSGLGWTKKGMIAVKDMNGDEWEYNPRTRKLTLMTEATINIGDVDRALEEAQIDEISDKMKDRYIQKSMGDHQHAKAVRKDAESRGDKDLASKMKDRMKKRNQGMTRAYGVAEASDTQMGTITVTTDAQRKARAQAYRDKKAKEAMKKEEAELDEAQGTAAKHAGKSGVFGGKYTSHDHMMGMKNFSAIRDKRAKQKHDAHMKQDPKHAKAGYAQHMVDTDKAKKKAAKRGVDASHLNYRHTNGLKQESTQIDELSKNTLASYVKKADKQQNPDLNKVRAARDKPGNGAENSRKEMEVQTRKAKNRTKGVYQAIHKYQMKNEEAEPVAEKSKGLWANIHAKRKRGEKPNPPGHPDRPTKADFERSQK